MQSWVENDENLEQGKSTYFKIEGCVTWLPGLSEGKPAYYLSCQTCKKKVTDEDHGFHCISCDQTYKEANPNYIFQAKVCDYSSAAFVSFMGDTGNSVLGMEASELHEIYQGGENVEEKVKEIIEGSYFKPMALIVRAKREAFNGEPSTIRYIA